MESGRREKNNKLNERREKNRVRGREGKTSEEEGEMKEGKQKWKSRKH